MWKKYWHALALELVQAWENIKIPAAQTQRKSDFWPWVHRYVYASGQLTLTMSQHNIHLTSTLLECLLAQIFQIFHIMFVTTRPENRHKATSNEKFSAFMRHPGKQSNCTMTAKLVIGQLRLTMNNETSSSPKQIWNTYRFGAAVAPFNGHTHVWFPVLWVHMSMYPWTGHLSPTACDDNSSVSERV